MNNVKGNKGMFWTGIVMMIATGIALVFIEKDLGAWPMLMAILGIVFIGASKYRLLK